MGRTVRIGTRESRLAVIQAELVAAGIQRYHPEIAVELVMIKTTGDRILDKTPDKIGGKGVFVKELDEALLQGEVDICVHSYKDVPATDNPELPIVAVSPREDPRDALVLPRGIDAIDPGKPIGCSSRRRQTQLRRLFPGQPLAPVRGNVLTRLSKLDSGEYSALVLAAAGLIRLELLGRVSHVFAPGEILPAGCQGVMAVQGRRGADFGWLSGYGDSDALDATRAERAFTARVGWGCGAPVAAYAEITGDTLYLRGMLAAEADSPRYGEISGPRARAAELGAALAEKMLSEGKYGG